MKSMLLLMESFNRWRPEVDHSSTELTMEIKTLTSRVEALEANTAPPSAPKREEEGRAIEGSRWRTRGGVNSLF